MVSNAVKFNHGQTSDFTTRRKHTFSKPFTLTSVIKEPPHVDRALSLFLLELLTGVQQSLIGHVQGNRRAPLI